MKHLIQLTVFLLACGAIMPVTGYAQKKLTRNQILEAVRTHQQNVDSVQVSEGDLVSCDSTTTKITLETLNDSLAHNHTFKLCFTKDGIEVDVYDDDCYLYRSTFEYANSSYEDIKDIINKRNLRKVDSYDDTYEGKENYVLRLYRGNKSYMSVESYNKRTNVNEGFHELVADIKELAPDISSVIAICDEDEESPDSLSEDTDNKNIVISETSLQFKTKGGEFKKVKITCKADNWEILTYPEWLLVSRNKNNEVIVESTKNTTKQKREGDIVIGINDEQAIVKVTQL